jgi:hypothetical protein
MLGGRLIARDQLGTMFACHLAHRSGGAERPGGRSASHEACSSGGSQLRVAVTCGNVQTAHAMAYETVSKYRREIKRSSGLITEEAARLVPSRCRFKKLVQRLTACPNHTTEHASHNLCTHGEQAKSKRWKRGVRVGASSSGARVASKSRRGANRQLSDANAPNAVRQQRCRCQGAAGGSQAIYTTFQPVQNEDYVSTLAVSSAARGSFQSSTNTNLHIHDGSCIEGSVGILRRTVHQ